MKPPALGISQPSRWPDGFVCPACGHDRGWELKRRRASWECAACGKETSVTAGTIMHRSHLPLKTWLMAVHIVTSHSNGISALQLQAQLGLGSYKSAWLLLHKLRRAMVDPDRSLLEDLVEIDEAILAQDALQPLGHRPADDLHRGQIFDGGEVEPAFVSWDVGDVSEPDRIGRSGFEVAVEQIERDRMGVAAVGGDRHLPPASRWTNAVLSHELGDRALRDAKAAGLQLSMDPRHAVAPLALLEDLPDL